LVVCRELTKLFEQNVRASAAEILTCFENGTIPEKGEFVIVARSVPPDDDVDVDTLLRSRLAAAEGPNQAAKSVAAETGLSKSDLYRRALELRAEDQSG
jgi:16S rRNA (cytidine1402-2'-O)-methyltransferase